MTKTHIVIDARLYGPKHTGLGRYTKNLLIAISKNPKSDFYKFTLLVYPELKQEIISDLGNKFEYHETNIRHYSFYEQIILPFVLFKLKPSLVHFTHFDKPILYFGKSVVTVHDLIRHFSKGKDTTTRNPYLYYFKYLGYLLMSWFIIRFNYLIVPSNFWRNYIIDHYRIKPGKIITTYEAVDPSISNNNQIISKPSNYIIYTGNLYPHKNIDILFLALKQLPQIKLKIICARDVFANRVTKLANKLGVNNQIEFLGFLPDNEFSRLYSQSLALVHPAKLEGFGLTGLEAMALNCPVISSNSSCLPEIYQDAVLYFDPLNEIDLITKISLLKNDKNLRLKLIYKGQKLLTKYSWTKTATETLAYYHTILK